MLTGDELRAAREAAGLTQQQLGNRLGRTLRSVGNWERAPRVPEIAERQVRREFPEWFGAPANPLTSVSDAQLLAEIARRFDRTREQDGDGHGQQQPASIGTPSDEALDPTLPEDLALAARVVPETPATQGERDQQDHDAEEQG